MVKILYLKKLLYTNIQSHHAFASYTKGSLYARVWSHKLFTPVILQFDCGQHYKGES